MKQQKRQAARERETKKRIAEKLAQKRAQQIACRVLPPPRYDDVFFEGLAWLDELAGVKRALVHH
ncbi:MAG: hypothetical protein FWD69_19840 [Polyangiaceae bacterium]|nr:hypothetical protein [Polyangiaceae bacterium]